MIPIVALYFMIAGTFTVGKILLSYVPPIFLIAVRMILAGLLLLSMQYCFKRRLLIQRQDIPLFLITGFVHIFMTFVFEFIALASLAPSCVALMFNLSPFFTAIFSYFLFKEKFTIKKAIGFIIGMIGVSCMVSPTTDEVCYRFLDPQYFVLFIAVMSGSMGWLLVRKLLYRGYDPMHINGSAMLIGGAGALVCSLIVEPNAGLPWGNMHEFLPLLICIIVFANIVFYNFYGYLLKRYTATLLSFVGFLTPLFTALYDWVFLGIEVEPSFYIATVVVAYGIYIFYQEELQQGYIAK